MAEFAFSPYETVNSLLPGYTRNPYALDRVTAGSSGGTAAAVARTSARSARQRHRQLDPRSLVAPGARRHPSTMGLTSRAAWCRSACSPTSRADDAHGRRRGRRVPGDRGEDPDDPATAAAQGRPIPNYAQSLQRDGLKGARIGILRQAYERETTDPEIVDVFMAAVEDLKRAGAVIVDPVRVDLPSPRRPQGAGSCGGFKYDINRYLAAQGDRVPVHNLDEIIRSRPLPSVDRSAPAIGAGRHRERAGHGGLHGGNGIPGSVPRRRRQRRWTTTGWRRSSTRRGATRRG
jgi:hypothetical protein